MKEGDMPTLSSRTQAQTWREWAEYFLRLSAEVDGHTFFTASRRSVAILLPVMNSNGAFFGSVTGNRHAVRLCKTAGSYDHLQCYPDGAYCWVLCICREFDLLTILTVLLDAPGDLYGHD